MSLGINTQKSSSLNSLNYLNQAKIGKNSAIEKLSSGLRINKGADDPAGLLISELLRSQIGGYERALRNTQETSNVLSIAEGGLSGVSAMLTRMKGLAIHALNSGVTSPAQTQTDQGELNSSLSSIQRVVDTTSYAGSNLLNGVRTFTFGTNDPASVIDRRGTTINSVSGLASRNISVEFAGGAAAQAEKAYMEADFSAPAAGTAQEFTIIGNNGAQAFSFAAGASV